MRGTLGGESMKRPISKTAFYDFVGMTFDQLCDEIRALRVRLETLESADTYKGIWQRALPYRKGAQVSHQGALWVCLSDSNPGLQPSQNPTHWQLAAKPRTKGKLP
ncbi:hypothetical protein ASD76_09350 [Altererythrobacter sp. Root672]|nr:hypothetical protein ASD76_09350 [Altererythrobacter sp. Root672]